MRSMLDRNDEVIILVEGYASENDEIGADLAFARAATVAKMVKQQLGPQYEDRIYLHECFESSVPTSEVWIFPNPEGIIYRPKEADRVLEQYTVEGSEENLVNIDAQVDAALGTKQLASKNFLDSL